MEIECFCAASPVPRRFFFCCFVVSFQFTTYFFINVDVVVVVCCRLFATVENGLENWESNCERDKAKSINFFWKKKYLSITSHCYRLLRMSHCWINDTNYTRPNRLIWHSRSARTKERTWSELKTNKMYKIIGQRKHKTTNTLHLNDNDNKRYQLIVEVFLHFPSTLHTHTHTRKETSMPMHIGRSVDLIFESGFCVCCCVAVAVVILYILFSIVSLAHSLTFAHSRKSSIYKQILLVFVPTARYDVVNGWTHWNWTSPARHIIPSQCITQQFFNVCPFDRSVHNSRTRISLQIDFRLGHKQLDCTKWSTNE